MCCSPDGTRVPIAQRNAGAAIGWRAVQDPGGESRSVPHGRAADPEDRAAGTGRGLGTLHGGDRQSKDADPGRASPFARRLWRAAERFGFAPAKWQVVIGDGARKSLHLRKDLLHCLAQLRMSLYATFELLPADKLFQKDMPSA